MTADSAPTIARLFINEPTRHNALAVNTDHVRFDFSKQLQAYSGITSALHALEARGLVQRITALSAGAKINTTEGREVTHMLLRHAALSAQHDAARKLADRIASGAISTIINLGIGGSDLGLRLVDDAFRAAEISQRVALRFCTGLDPAEWREAVADLNPETTAFVLASKSFSTLETLTTGARARQWLGAYATTNLFATTTAPSKAIGIGVSAENIAAFDESVGGRYSVWSAVNLPIRVAYGNAAVDALLAGAASMDQHFCNTPLPANAPVLAALARHFNRNQRQLSNHVVVPYAWGLRKLAEYLQQLVMESNGKRVDIDTGAAITTDPCSAVWGTVGTAAQHAYFQWLHQHPVGAAVDIIAVKPSADSGSVALFENAAAQSRALAFGHAPDAADPLLAHKTSPGNRPNNFIALPSLAPESIGALLAFYEASVFVEAFIAGINPFDQYGVEFGKVLAKQIANGEMGDMDASTKALLAWSRQ
ncbi:MAG: glucose-6-phosphate isomerase [Burkholderiales bacterium]|nr:MAG: glucose-6-phosphate isomerase [Betaproteobacteria bacterium]TAG28490.1 MAG: glucose-6-phosphate isomerase [Burkholderiales bacterium]